MTDPAKPGAVLKALRTKKGWTLAEVAERTGFPVSTLSKIENDKMSLTYDKLARISKGLKVDIGVFFAPESPSPQAAAATGRRSIIRQGEGKTIETRAYGQTFLATDLLNKHFVPVFVEVHARSLEEFGDLIRHPGEEFALVVEGAVDLHSDLYAPVRLESGDAIYFDSGMGHAYIAVGDGPCRIISICSGEESQLMKVSEKDAISPRAEPPEPTAARTGRGRKSARA